MDKTSPTRWAYLSAKFEPVAPALSVQKWTRLVEIGPVMATNVWRVTLLAQ